MRYKTYLPFLILLSAFVSCKNGTDTTNQTDTAKTDGHPSWIMQGNIYEVNVRQYTPEGTFQAFAKHLDRLKEMGVQTLWFMPINPISKTDRKGSLGSYYAVSDYTAINPEYGNMDDWKALVKQAHDKGFKVIIDWVPNHTGADHYWLQKHPDFYVRDSSGKAVSQFDWTDTRKLNFANAELHDTMISQMKYWVTETGIDGFRCDYAVGPTRSFWKDCLKELKAVKNVFMLAETDSAWLHEVGFDATYAWPEFNMMKLIAAGKRNASAMDSVFNQTDTSLQKNALRLFFTKEDYTNITETEEQKNLLQLVNDWLERMPFFTNDYWKKYESAAPASITQHPFWNDYRHIYQTGLTEREQTKIYDFDYVFFEQPPAGYTPEQLENLRSNFTPAALRAALFIMLYRDFPVFQTSYQILDSLIEIDHLMSSWRHKHLVMVRRMIGMRVGTGNTSGAGYLEGALSKHYVYRDISGLSTYLIERRKLPKLPEELIRNLGFTV